MGTWFSRIQRNVVSRGIVTSVKDLDKKLMRYSRQYDKSPKPLKWKCDYPNGRHYQCFWLSGLAPDSASLDFGSARIAGFTNSKVTVYPKQRK